MSIKTVLNRIVRIRLTLKAAEKMMKRTSNATSKMKYYITIGVKMAFPHAELSGLAKLVVETTGLLCLSS
jgi:hypothetical protein